MQWIWRRLATPALLRLLVLGVLGVARSARTARVATPRASGWSAWAARRSYQHPRHDAMRCPTTGDDRWQPGIVNAHDGTRCPTGSGMGKHRAGTDWTSTP